MSPRTVPALTLVIAVYRRDDFLERIFVSLLNQTFTDFEVLVADDGSGPEMARCIESYAPVLPQSVRHVWHEDDGFRKTIIVNRAVAEASGGHLVFIDGDCVLHHRFLERHWVRRKPRQVLSGRRVMLKRPVTERMTLEEIRSREIESFTYWWNDCNENTRQNGLYLPFAFELKNRNRDDYEILGSNFSVSKADFLEINGYDERIIGRGLEDNNLCARFINSGIAVRSIANEALQYHCFHTSKPIPHDEEFVRRFRSSAETRTSYGVVKETVTSP